MDTIDNEIKNLDDVICKNISRSGEFRRGEISQNILNALRNLVEHIMVKIYTQEKNMDIPCKDMDIPYDTIQKAVKHVNISGDWKDISRFHKYLQKSVSHFTANEVNAERLMLKYYEYLLNLKKLCQKNFRSLFSPTSIFFR